MYSMRARHADHVTERMGTGGESLVPASVQSFSHGHGIHSAAIASPLIHPASPKAAQNEWLVQGLHIVHKYAVSG